MRERVVKYPERPTKKRRHKVFFWFLLCILCAGGFLCLGQTISFLETRSELQSLEAKRDALQLENENFREEMLLLHDEGYIEILARRHLGMVRPGEIIFHVDN